MSLIIAPPPKIKTSYGGNGEWNLYKIDFDEGSRYIDAFYESYMDVGKDPDFSKDVRPVVSQFLIALSKRESVKAILKVRNYGTRLQISSIATPVDEFEVAKVLVKLIQKNEILDVDVITLQRMQPKWLLSYQFYKKKMED